MDNRFETEEPFIVTTADMLEIAAGGGNGSEYVDIVGLMETAAKELREKDDKIERLRKVLRQITELSPFKFNTGHASLQSITQALVEMTSLAHESLKEKE